MMGENFLSLCYFLHVIVLILPHSEGVIKFTLEPSDPSYAWKGSNARLVWDYNVDDKQKELLGIGFYVLVSNRPFLGMLVQFKNGTVAEHSQLPAAYRGRVMIEGNASLIIENVSAQDNTRFMCRLFAELGADHESVVQLIVTEIPVFSPSSINGSYIEGSSVNISCTATGKPDPEVSWIRNGQIKSFGRKTANLNFDKITRTDDGMYTCTANNSAGTKTHIETLVVRYPAKILNITLSAASSWIGQTVTLKCVSDGVPTPTLTWYKPDRNELNTVTAKESTIDVTINSKQDFGEYKCAANNGLDPLSDASLFLRQIEKPGSPVIVFSSSDIQATSLTVKWTAPADDGGSPITAYRVVILKGGTEIRNENVTDPDLYKHSNLPDEPKDPVATEPFLNLFLKSLKGNKVVYKKLLSSKSAVPIKIVRCDREVEILHAVYLSIIILLEIIIVIIRVISWRKRQIPAIHKCEKW
ncbi:muscle, skeletal receptor tyrosine-protein kinase-like [Oculina patagonica]